MTPRRADWVDALERAVREVDVQALALAVAVAGRLSQPLGVDDRVGLARRLPAALAERLVPLTSLLPREVFVDAAPNAIAFEKYPELKRRVFDALSLSTRKLGWAFFFKSI